MTKPTPSEPTDAEIAALHAVTALIASDGSLHDLLDTIARFAAERMGAQYAAILQFPTDDHIDVRAAWAGTSSPMVMLDQWLLADDEVARRIIQQRAATREEAWDEIDDVVGRVIVDRFGITSSVGLPIVVDDAIWGALFIHSTREKLTPDVEARLEPFAHLIAVSVSSARRQSDLRRLLHEQEALQRVAQSVADGRPPDEVFAVVAEELGHALTVVSTKLVRFNDNGTGTFVASWGPIDGGTPTGVTLPTTGTSVTGQIRSTGRPARVDDYGIVEGQLGSIVRSSGVRSAAGAPIIVDDNLWGALIVGSVDPRPLPVDTESRVDAFARLVSMAISNVESTARAQALFDEQAALRRVATAVAHGDWPTILTTILDEVVAVSPVDGAAMLRFESDGTATVVAGTGQPRLAEYMDSRIRFDGDNPAAAVWLTGEPARQDSWATARGELAEMTRAAGITSSVAVPIVVDSRVWGVIVVVSIDPALLPLGTEQQLGKFAELVAAAVGNLEARSALIESRARIVSAVDRARQMIERDLHDGIQQRLVSVQLDLARIQSTLPQDDRDTRDRLEQVRKQLGETLDSLREIARGVHPAILSAGGLALALRGLVRRIPLVSELRVEELPTLPASIEVAAYYVVSEALANTVKHAGAGRVVIHVRCDDARLHVRVSDDGVGGADLTRGSGLVGLVDRVEALGGSLEIVSIVGVGTTLQADLPAVR